MSKISCEQLENFIVDFIDEKLPASQRSEFSAHIDYCPKCKVYLENYKKTINASKAVHAQNSNDSDMPEALVQAILTAKNTTGQ